MTTKENKKLFIALAGNIGAGKSTLAASLAKMLNVTLYKEQVAENRYLKEFYAGLGRQDKPNKVAFQLEMDMLKTRYSQQQKINWSMQGGVQDRSLYEDVIFARVLKNNKDMNEEDYSTYMEWYELLESELKRPDVLVYLKASPEVCLARIKERLSMSENEKIRSMEKDITLEYLQILDNEYTKEIARLSHKMYVICIDWNEFKSPDEISKQIINSLKLHTDVNQSNFVKLVE